MYKSIADGFKVINATEGLKGFTLVSWSFTLRIWITLPSMIHIQSALSN